MTANREQILLFLKSNIVLLLLFSSFLFHNNRDYSLFNNTQTIVNITTLSFTTPSKNTISSAALAFSFHHSFRPFTNQATLMAKQQQISQSRRDPDEKYITFFTHSGFQNQLIQVENGILLAWYLNRTLLLPKALLGEAFGWNHFSKLHKHHLYRDTNNIYCNNQKQQRWRFRSKKAKRNKAAKCPKPSKYAMTSFDDLFDLSWAKQHVKIEQREQSDFDWLRENYGIQWQMAADDTEEHGVFVNGDVLYFKDKTRYDWRIYDVPVRYKFLGKYVDAFDAQQLQNRTEKLIHFTSLFGTGKFPIKKAENMQFFRDLQRSMTYKHPAVLNIADILMYRLGGPGNYVGVHLRTADGLFIDAVSENIHNIVQQITNNNASVSPVLQEWMVSPINRVGMSHLLDKCIHLAKSNQTTLVFLATDAVDPRKNEVFQNLWHHLPCTFTLNEIIDSKDSLWSHMDQFRTVHTGESMRKFLIPLIDALVASRGSYFVGSKGSTFSGYIRRLQDEYYNINS